MGYDINDIGDFSEAHPAQYLVLLNYWEPSAVGTLLGIGVLLAGAASLRTVWPWLRRMAIPTSILAGLLGLALGQDGLSLFPFDHQVLETLVYHGLAIVFIAVGLQAPARVKGKISGGVRSFTFGIPFMECCQILIGLLVVVGLGAVQGAPLHPGFGALLPLGFEQGPGQALSLGKAWEATGFTDGAQIGLIVANLGFAWSIFIGVPLVLYGKAHGWLEKRPKAEPKLDSADELGASLAPGGLEPLSLQVAIIALTYGLTWAVCLGLSRALAGMPDIASVVWGFHFMIGAGVAMALRPLLARLPRGTPVDDRMMGRISGFMVDLMTCAAIAAVQVAVFQANWLVILAVTTAGGLLTLGVTLYFTSRAFPDAPFEHAILWFGMSTGTLPMGLALLRIVDPRLESPAPVTAVLGSAGAVVGAVVPLLVILPMCVAAWPHGGILAPLIWVAATAAYGILLLILWRLFAPLRFHRPLGRLWWRPEQSDPEEGE